MGIQIATADTRLPARTTTDDDGLDAQAVRDMLAQFRRRHVEPAWAQLNGIDHLRFSTLWRALHDTGLTAAALPETHGGLPGNAPVLHVSMQQLGAACPALACAWLSHLTAQHALLESNAGAWPHNFDANTAFALLASPLDAQPHTGFTIERRNGVWQLRGTQRAMLPNNATVVLPARSAEGLHLCVVNPETAGIAFTATPSSHGLCLLPFGELRASNVLLNDTHVFEWPASGHTANLADGLVTALAGGMLDELALRASDYARERIQAGKPIIEHHAVQHLLGSLELARTPVHALARATLVQSRSGDGCASAFAITQLRRAALDAIQVFGGYGYMEDYRVERYLRDANTLETFWVHAAQRERDLVITRSAARERGETA